MFNLKMVDTAGGGIKKIVNYQRERYFPMPDYDLSGGKVKVTISGKILDMEYAHLLARNKDLTWEKTKTLHRMDIPGESEPLGVSEIWLITWFKKPRWPIKFYQSMNKLHLVLRLLIEGKLQRQY